MENEVAELWEKVQRSGESPDANAHILEDVDRILGTLEGQECFQVLQLRLIAFKAGRQCDLKQLIADLENEAKRNPTNPSVWICIAEAQLHVGHPDEAIPPLEFALTLGEDPDVLNLLSLCQRRKTSPNNQESFDLAKRSIKADINNGKSWANLGCAYLGLGGFKNLKQSRKAFLMAMKNGENTNADTVFNLATVTEILLDFVEAEHLYNEAIQLTGGWIQAVQNAERVHTMLQKVQQKVQVIESLKPKKKAEYTKKLQAETDFLIVETPFDKSATAQIVVGINNAGHGVAFGVTQTLRAYVRREKTIFRISKQPVEQGGFPYVIIETPSDVQILNGATPQEIAGAKVTSSLV